MDVFIGLMIPFIGTSLGASLVYLFNNKLSSNFEAIILAFSAGIMMAASIWSLLIPSINLGFIPTIVGFIIGILFLSLFNNNTSNMIMAVALHNIPEGMAVGVSYLSLLTGSISISYISCLMLSIGIAIQNFPEGAIISLPLNNSGVSKNKSFIYGVMSGVVEPVFGFITIIFSKIFVFLLPYCLGFAAGAMIYVVVRELIPESSKYKFFTYYYVVGFLIMMILDVLFS